MAGRASRLAAGLCLVLSVAGPAVAAPATPAASDASDAPVAFACTDISAAAGIDHPNRYGLTVAPDEGGTIMQRNMGSGAAVGDHDADGDLDIYLLAQAGQRSILYRNDVAADGSRRYTDVTGEAGVEDLGLGRVAHFADLDGDGHLDLVVLNDTDPDGRLPPSRLFRNDGDGTFTDVTADSGFHPVGFLVGGASLIDVDLDADLDIFVTYWTMELGGTPPGQTPAGALPGSNRLFRNDGDMRFTDITDASGLGGVTLDAFTPVFHDWDGDRDLDLYIAVDHRADLFYEQRAGRFVDVSEAAGISHVGNDMGVAMGDVNADGLMDLFVTNIADPEENFGKKPRGNTLLLAERPSGGGVRFTDDAYGYAVRETAWGWGTAFIDLDLDGTLDLYAVQGFDEFVSIYSRTLYEARSFLFTRSGTGPFTQVTDTGCDVPGDQRSLIPFDHDRDGDVDLLITQVGLPALLLENRTATGRGLTVSLRGPAASGARIDVSVGGRTTSQVVMHGGSYLAGPPLEAIFGLGEAAVADSVTITDVRGRTRRFADVPAGETLRVDLP